MKSADRLERLDDWITDDLPPARDPDELADWLAPRNSDGGVAIIEINGRDVLLCYTSARWTDAAIADLCNTIRRAGWPITGFRGCPRQVVIEVRYHGGMVLLDAPLANIYHAKDIEVT